MIRMWSSPVAALAALGVAMVPTAAPDRTPPRIVSAMMVDLNGNARAERVRLTYSERVRHARDNDGKYSFVVVGYRVLAVGAATGRSLVLLVKERVSADSAARPVVRYRKTSSKPVLDGAGNQASAQAFRLTRAHGHVPPSQPKPTPTPAPAPAPTPPSSSAPDSDKDGYDDAHDCAPNNAAIHPNAPDLPDLGFVDSNCDQVDGTEADAVFVSPRGNDANPGTKAQPKRQIQAAVLEAAKSGKDVFAAGGDYGAVDAQTGVAVYGGYDPATWQRSLQLKTTITGTPQGFFLAGDKDVLLQLLTIVGTTGSGSNVYGIRALDDSELTLQRVTVTAAPAPDGLPGAGGADGRGGYDGNEGRAGACDDDTGGQGATGGLSWGGQLGNGGTGGHGGNAFGDRGDGQPGYAGGGGVVGLIGGAGGVGGKTGNPGRLGGSGQPGLRGALGRPGAGGTTPAAGIAWTGQAGQPAPAGTQARAVAGAAEAAARSERSSRTAGATAAAAEEGRARVGSPVRAAAGAVDRSVSICITRS